jgi:hypothetical protein
MLKSSRTNQATTPEFVEVIDLTGDGSGYAIRDLALADAYAITTQTTVYEPAEVIDLTGNTEQCAICENVLGEGDGEKARTFVLQTCHCVGSPLESVLVSIR